MTDTRHDEKRAGAAAQAIQIAENVRRLDARIRELEARYGRDPLSVALLAVSKKKSVVDVQAALDAGQRAFGENYLDEAEAKIDALPQADIEWHFIGAVQSRKTAAIARRFQWVHSVDREKIVVRLSRQRPEELGPLNLCLQVNIDNEHSKSGVQPDELGDLAALCSTLPGVRLRGLMCIPAPRTDFSEQRAVCRALKSLFERMRLRHPELDTLSMGMSDDMEAAIAEGSTMLRIGTSLFGPR